LNTAAQVLVQSTITALVSFSTLQVVAHVPDVVLNPTNLNRHGARKTVDRAQRAALATQLSDAHHLVLLRGAQQTL
jgi:hypothetical protein